MKIGFIGLGIMGSRMAGNLVKKGYNLTVHNRTREKEEKLAERGAERGESMSKTAESSYILITTLSTPDVVEEAALGEDGFLDSMNDNSIWMDCSTVNPSFTRRMAEEAKKRNVRFIDAPVAGSLKPAESGELLFLVGGEDKDVEECKPLFDVMGRSYIFAGENGMGSSLKMIVNMLMGQAMHAFCEALSLGKSLGFSETALLEILPDLPVVPTVLKGKKRKFAEKDFSPEFPLKWMQKDLHLASLSAYENGISMPSANLVKEAFMSAVQRGMGDEDFSALYKFVKGEE